jgi:hypothetical protein
MPESLRTKSYDDRASSQLGVGDYILKHVISGLLPLIGIGVGYGLGKVMKESWFGKNYYNSGFVKRFFGKDPQAMAHLNEMAAQNPHMQNGIIWGGKIGAAWVLYNLWKDQKASNLGVDDIQKELVKIKDNESTNSYLARENDQLFQQISWMDRDAGVKPNTSHAESVRESQLAADAALTR